MIGKKFGLWTVLSTDSPRGTSKYLNCKCECGVTRSVALSNLVSGGSKSCGCMLGRRILFPKTREVKPPEASRKPRGPSLAQTYPKEYTAWCNLKVKKIRPPKWEEFSTFLAEIGEAPSEKHRLSSTPDKTIFFWAIPGCGN